MMQYCRKHGQHFGGARSECLRCVQEERDELRIERAKLTVGIGLLEKEKNAGRFKSVLNLGMASSFSPTLRRGLDVIRDSQKKLLTRATSAEEERDELREEVERVQRHLDNEAELTRHHMNKRLEAEATLEAVKKATEENVIPIKGSWVGCGDCERLDWCNGEKIRRVILGAGKLAAPNPKVATPEEMVESLNRQTSEGTYYVDRTDAERPAIGYTPNTTGTSSMEIIEPEEDQTKMWVVPTLRDLETFVDERIISMKKRAVEAGTGDSLVELVTGKDKVLVIKVSVPPFIEMPKVLVWGSRTFMMLDEETEDGDYRAVEVFAYHVPIHVGTQDSQ